MKFSSFKKDQLIMESWRRYLKEEDKWERQTARIAAEEEGASGNLDQAIKSIASGKFTKKDQQLVLALFLPLEGAADEPTVGALKALIKIIAVDQLHGGNFLAQVAEAGWGDVVGAAGGSLTGSMMTMAKEAVRVAKKHAIKSADADDVVSKLMFMPDNEQLPAVFKALDLADGYSVNLNKSVLKDFLAGLMDSFKGKQDATPIPPDYSNKEMQKTLITRGLVSRPAAAAAGTGKK